MPARILLIRHGETDYNKEPRIQGWLDIPLNENGHKQAYATSQILATHRIDALYSSDLKRARETAKPIAEVHRLEIRYSEKLRERDMGIFAGWSWEKEKDDEKSSLWEEFESARDNNDLHWDKHKGESLHQMSLRIQEFFDYLHTEHKDQHVALVTHGGTINRIFEYLEIKKAVEGYRPIGNGAVHIVVKKTSGYTLIEG